MPPSSVVVANIAYNQDGTTELHLERLIKATTEHRMRARIAGFAEVSSNNIVSLSQGSVHEDAELRKASNKGLKAALRVKQLLTHTFKDEDLEDDRSATINIGDTSIVGGPPTDCHARDIVGITSFEKVDFNFPGTTDFRSNMSIMAPCWTPPTPSRVLSTQYLHFSCPSLKIEDTIIDSNGQPRYDSISIVSGNCLFSNSIISSCDLSDGTLDLSPLSFSKPTIYEMEYIARAAPAIADLACTILSRNKALDLATPFSINLDIPNWHYYKAVDKKLQSGLCTAQDALLYLVAVERRYDQVSSVFETAIRHECYLRGEANPVINISSRLGVVTEHIKSALAAGMRPEFDLVMQKLDEQEDGVWRRFFEPIPVKERPANFEELGHLFYVFQVIKAVFRNCNAPETPCYNFKPSLQLAAPEEMSICLPMFSSAGKLSTQEKDAFLINASRREFGPAWSQYEGDTLAAFDNAEGDNELSFDASSTVDIKVVSSETWRSADDTGSSDFEDDVNPESVTVVQQTTSMARRVVPEIETVICRSPRLIGQDKTRALTTPKIFHLRPTSDSFISAVCMLGGDNASGAVTIAEAADEHSHDAMLSTFEAASSFCVGIIDATPQPSSDDEIASHGFMLPSPAAFRSIRMPSPTHAGLNEAVPILTDHNTSHAAMLVTYVGPASRQFEMDTGISEHDGVALDDIASFAAMLSLQNVTITECKAAAEHKRQQPAFKDELLSGAVMLPTSEVASHFCMADAGCDMKEAPSSDAVVAHEAMRNATGDQGTISTYFTQPVGSGEHDSCVAMLPTSEAASTACMVATAGDDLQPMIDEDHSSHAAMLSTFEQPDFLGMTKEMCLAAAMSPIETWDDYNHIRAAVDEAAAHAAMLRAAEDLELHETISIDAVDLQPDDATVSHFAMLSSLDAASSACMAASATPYEAKLCETSATMPANDHVSHIAMMCTAVDESSACMVATLTKYNIYQEEGMRAATPDVELASHAAMRGIIDLSSSFCMAETIATLCQTSENEAPAATTEEVDHHVAMYSASTDDEVSNITMLFSPADEAASHAGMLSEFANGSQPMPDLEQASHVAMLPDSFAPLYLDKTDVRLSTILEDTVDALASHAAMVPTSNDEFISHEAMLPTSTDESTSHRIMRPTSNDETISHRAMVPKVEAEDSSRARAATEVLGSHDAMLTSSICMAATLAPKTSPSISSLSSTACTRTNSTCSSASSSSSGFLKLPKAKKSRKTTAEDIKKLQVLILSVDDNSERKIYSRSQKLLKKVRASPNAVTYPTLVEAYLMRRVFINGNAEGSNLYLEDPSPSRPICEDGHEMEPVDLVRELYGEEAAQNLDKWFKDVGLGL